MLYSLKDNNLDHEESVYLLRKKELFPVVEI